MPLREDEKKLDSILGTREQRFSQGLRRVDVGELTSSPGAWPPAGSCWIRSTRLSTRVSKDAPAHYLCVVDCLSGVRVRFEWNQSVNSI
jgi:hypothetical protein